MKTVHYTFTSWDGGATADGLDNGLSEGRQTAMTRRADGRTARGGNKVIDLNVWRATDLDEHQEEPDKPPVFTPRPRGGRRSMPVSELVCTLSVAAAALALILRVLTF